MENRDIVIGDIVEWCGVNGEMRGEVIDRGGVLVCDTGGGYCMPIECLVSSRSFRVVGKKGIVG